MENLDKPLLKYISDVNLSALCTAFFLAIKLAMLEELCGEVGIGDAAPF